jgi:hypothetical protein
MYQLTGHDVCENRFPVQNMKNVTTCAGWAGPPSASSWKTQLSLSWGNQREFDVVIRAVVKVCSSWHASLRLLWRCFENVCAQSCGLLIDVVLLARMATPGSAQAIGPRRMKWLQLCSEMLVQKEETVLFHR